MREIKFRAWDTKGQYFKPLEDDGDFYFRDDGDGLSLYDKWGECKDTILLQYTGLKDKNGKEIYEGDVIKYRYARDMSGKDFVEFTEVVEWENTTDFIGFGVHQLMEHEIIGNIYENPELINPAQTATNSKQAPPP